MNVTRFNELSLPVSPGGRYRDGLLTSTAFTPAARQGARAGDDAQTRAADGVEHSFFKMAGGGGEDYYNTRQALAARKKRKKTDGAMLYLQRHLEHDLMPDELERPYLYPWKSSSYSYADEEERRRLRRQADLDRKKASADADRKKGTADADRKKGADADGRRATDADGKRPVAAAKSRKQKADRSQQAGSGDGRPAQAADTRAAPAAGEALADDFASSKGADTGKFSTFLGESGESLEGFQSRAEAALDRPAEIGASAADIPGSRLNAGRIRAGRVLRMVTPNGLDLLVIGAVGGAAGLMAGSPTLTLDGVGYDFNEGAAAKAGAETMPVVGTSMAAAEGRSAEAGVRGFEDTVEFASPFALAGIGLLMGGPLGGLAGLAAGIGVSLFASEVSRTAARGLGFDVDRGIVGSLFAQERAEEMEGWIRSVTNDSESASEIMAEINEGDPDLQERTSRFRSFLDRKNLEIYDGQVRQAESVTERIGRDTGLTDVSATLRLPEARKTIADFYRQQAEQDPGDEEAGRIVKTLEGFEKTEADRIKVVAARVGTDMMDAAVINETLEERLTDNLASRLENTSVTEDLAGIGFQERVQAIRDKLEAAAELDVREVVGMSFESGADAFAVMGTTMAMADSAKLFMDAEDSLIAAQNELVQKNWDSLQIHMRADAVIGGGMFGNDTTLGKAVAGRLRESGTDDKTAEELRNLMAESDDLEVLNPELSARLLGNEIFREILGDVETFENDDALRIALDTGELDLRAQVIREVCADRKALEETARSYGFSLTTGPEAAQDFTPKFSHELTTEKEIEAPQPVIQ